MLMAASKLLRKLRELELELAVLLVLARLAPSLLGLVLVSRGREIPYMAGEGVVVVVVRQWRVSVCA
jgi:hypothetical protein